MGLRKEDFNAGTPYSSWLKEELIGEIDGYLHHMDNRGLVKKHRVRVDDKTEDKIMYIKKLDDLSYGLKEIAVDIIRMELDKNFKG